MAQEYPVRYGSVLRVVLAIVLPCFSIIPFILIMHQFKPIEEWMAWALIFTFLGILILFVLWLIKQVYPPVVLRVENNRIYFKFEGPAVFRPHDFSLTWDYIVSFEESTIAGDDVLRFRTKDPSRNFLISARSHSEPHAKALQSAAFAIEGILNPEKYNS